MDPYIRRAKVVSIYDADTLRADVDLGYGLTKHNEPFRLFGINAPEVRGAEKVAGKAARDALRQLLNFEVQPVIAIESIKADDKGKYGRYLAVIHAQRTGSDKWFNVNEWLVENGHAVYKVY